MKTLILMRHAKAEHFSSDLTDIHRELLPDGMHDAKKSAKKLLNLKLKIDELIASPSVRTIETSRIVRDVMLHHIKSSSVQERIYDASLDTLLGVISGVPNSVDTLMLIGHNPGLEELAEHFVGRSIHMRTSDLILLYFDSDTWQTIEVETPSKVLEHDEI